jgi:transcriptional regulator with XRE-family HTH domain
MIKKPQGKRATTTDTAIGGRMRAFRLARGLSQTQVADDLGVTFQQVQKYEKGVNRISGSRLVALCSLLQVKPEQILGNGSGVYHDEPDVFEVMQDKYSSKILMELHRLPLGQRQALLQVLQAIVRGFAGRA